MKLNTHHPLILAAAYVFLPGPHLTTLFGAPGGHCFTPFRNGPDADLSN
jgi:hypothetical protein